MNLRPEIEIDVAGNPSIFSHDGTDYYTIDYYDDEGLFVERRLIPEATIKKYERVEVFRNDRFGKPNE